MHNPETGMRKNQRKETQKLSFSLLTSDVPELRESAELLKTMWARIGVNVRVQILSQETSIRTSSDRVSLTLLFEIIGRDLDLFAFWHSSQRNDPASMSRCIRIRKLTSFLSAARD